MSVRYSTILGIILGVTSFVWTMMIMSLFTYPHFPTGSECYKNVKDSCMDTCGCILCNYTSEICVSEKERFLCYDNKTLSPECKNLRYTFDATLATVFVMSIFIACFTFLYLKEQNKKNNY